MPDVYPADAAARIRQLERDVADLKALLQARPALTQASQGWRMSDMSVPSVSSGTCHVGCNGGEFFSVNSAGTVKRMFSQAAAITNQVDFLSGQIGGAPTQTQYNNLQTDAVRTRAYAFDLTTILRNAGIIAV